MNVKLHYSLLLMIISSEGKLFQQNFKAFAPWTLVNTFYKIRESQDQTGCLKWFHGLFFPEDANSLVIP